ncbi:MAG: hypothetical protein EHM40_03250 [Chloroflexi bacterium]|nr:MAG: hypothetical protein EHM40_03250 [Chloroflexota bacterium]
MRSIKSIKQDALKEYETQQAQIRKLLKQIEAGLQKHDRNASSNPGGHHWGHVGDLTSIAETLTDLRDRLHGTGEYAEAASRYTAYSRSGKAIKVTIPDA